MQVGDLMAFIQYAMQIIMSFLMIAMMSIIIPRANCLLYTSGCLQWGIDYQPGWQTNGYQKYVTGVQHHHRTERGN